MVERLISPIRRDAPSSPCRLRATGIQFILFCFVFIALSLAFAMEKATWLAAAETRKPAYAGSSACRSCHQEQWQSWENSHHGWALRQPTAANVLADFGGATFTQGKVTSRFFQADGKYFVETDGADGALRAFEVKYVVGITPLQQYLVETENGRLQALDLAWDSVSRRWFHLYPGEDVSAGNGLHWTGPYKNWQSRCAVCHQTDFRKGFDPKTAKYQSKWSELTVGCEACHGPGQAHVSLMSKPDTLPDTALDKYGFVKPSGTTRQQREENMCGPCHSRRELISPDSSPPGSHFGDYYKLALLNDRLYFPDGQQKDEVYIMGSFLQSKMHAQGVTCSNCHEPHSATLTAPGNAVCTQCHNQAGRGDFPTLKPKDYDSPDHHHHARTSSGAQCVNCHMPERKYMVVDGRRDHFFRVPDPALALRTGAPDACTGCHLGKTPDWAAGQLKTWGAAHTSLATAYAEAFATVGREGISDRSRAQLVAIVGDDRQPPLVRASAIAALAGDTPAAGTLPLRQLLGDPSDLVRTASIRLSRSIPPTVRPNLLLPLLRDPIASVRIAAALELAGIPPEALPEADRNAFIEAIAELKASLQATADFPEGQMVLGGLAMATRNWNAAEQAFAAACFMDPQLIEAWLVRARIREALGESEEAIIILSRARASNGKDDQIGLNLALLLARQGRPAEAIPVLRETIAANPDKPDLRISLASILLGSGELDDARIEIDWLLGQAPDQADTLILLALHQLLSGDSAAARQTVQRLVMLHPGISLPDQLLPLGK